MIEGTAKALNPEQNITQYSLTQWGHRDGLPSTAIYAVAQTPDGFLWLGTSDGLVRFDGVRFVQVPLSNTGDLAFGRVQALRVDRTGAMWVGTESGSLVRMEGRSVKIVMLHVPIVAIRENTDSSIQVETPDHLLRFDPRSMELKSKDPGGVSDNRDPKRTSLASGQSINDKAFVCPQCEALGITSSLLERANLDPGQIRMAMRDNDGNVWIATRESGVVRVAKRSSGSPDTAPEIDRLSTNEGLSSDSVWDIFEDREHNLWVATQNGLNRLRDDKFSMVTRRTGLLSNDISSLVSAESGVFAGSNRGLNRVTTTHSETVLQGSIFSLARASDGSLFFATSLGLSQLKGGKVRLVPLGVDATHITVLLQGSSGELWFYDQDQGLYRWREGHTANRVINPALNNKNLSVMVADSHRRVWLGLTNGEIVFYDGAGFHTFTEGDNLPGGLLHSISAGSDGSVWIASERGLALYTGDRFVSWSKKNGLPGNRVLWAVPTAGRLWVGYNLGIASMRIEDLLHAASDAHFLVPYSLYDDGDGLKANPEVRGSTPVTVAPDGRIWLTTSEGLATIDPANIRKNLLPPPIRILQLTADDAEVDLTKSVTVPPRTHRVEINYSGLSLTDPRKVTFRYRLPGFDSQWSQASTRRFATYTNLPPGGYHFEVMAANDDGVWNETPGTLAFTVAPAVYQTKWFLALCILALILTAILLFRFRVRSAADRLRLRFEERLDERVRVAQDLHDNLLQEVMGISLQLEIADELTPPQAPGKPILRRALQLAESALTHGRGALTTLRATALTRQDIYQALTLATSPFSEERRRAVQYNIHGTELPVRAGVGEEIVQIGREALRNALQHTCGAVHVDIHYAPSRFCLVVDDEGQGMSSTTMESGVSGHFGLTGMRERAARIASTLTIESKVSGGTHVELSVPARMAYSGFDTAPGLLTMFMGRWTRGKRSAGEVSQDE